MASGGTSTARASAAAASASSTPTGPATGIDAASASASSSPNALSTSTPSRTPSSPGAGLAEPEADPHRRGGGRQQAGRDRVVEPDDRDPAVQRPRLVARVGGHRAVPVEVVLGDVEHHAGLRPQRRRPVQLEARQLDGQQLGGLDQHVEHRVADVAAQQRAAPGGDQHRVQHRRRGGLAVGAGHHQPAPRRAVAAGLVQPPGQFDVAPDRHARGGRGGQHRRGGRQAGAGDDQVVVGDPRRRRRRSMTATPLLREAPSAPTGRRR